MGQGKKLQRRLLLHEEVSQYIKETILTGELKPGDRIVESRLAQELGVSQAPVREALRNMLQEDFQLTIADAFPVNRAALRELMQKEIEAQKTEQQTAIRAEGRVEVGEAGDLAFLFDEAAADDLMNVLEHADCRSCGSQEILMIILDEADAFFKGRKTAQEAAQVMDRRAALFIAEAG